jgi:hypothetical protein
MTTVTSKKVTTNAPVVSDGGGSTHSYTEAEKVGFVDYINSKLANDADCKDFIPINPANLVSGATRVGLKPITDIFNLIFETGLLGHHHSRSRQHSFEQTPIRAVSRQD